MLSSMLRWRLFERPVWTIASAPGRHNKGNERTRLAVLTPTQFASNGEHSHSSTDDIIKGNE
jgi:hypothetical protein